MARKTKGQCIGANKKSRLLPKGKPYSWFTKKSGYLATNIFK